jgi:hypothetical protein
MIKLIDPLHNKDDERKMYLIAEMAAKFVSKFIYTMKINGVPEEVIPHIAVSLSHSIIGTLWADPESLNKIQDQKTPLEELDTSRLLPN